MQKRVKHVLIGVLIAGIIQKINYSFFLGFVVGSISIAIFLYIMVIRFIQNNHNGAQITFEQVNDDLVEMLHPIKKKRQHYINRFTNYILVDETETTKPQNQNLDLTIHKLGRKKYQKFMEVYCVYLEGVNDAEEEHGNSLYQLDNKVKIISENDYTVTHRVSEDGCNMEILQQLSGVEIKQGYQINLPQWKDFKRSLRQIGICHQEQAKMMAASIFESLNPVKKEYNKEVEEIRKSRRKLKQANVECYQHFQKVQSEFNKADEEALNQKQLYNEMLKRKDDPTSIIKQEMKVKLQLSHLDNVRTKMNDAKERVKEIQLNLGEFNGKLEKFKDTWEEQRLVYLKQCYQTSLVGFEDLSHKIQAQIINLIIIIDQDSCQIFPIRIQQQLNSPTNNFVQMIQTGQIEELQLDEQLRECIKSTEFLLQQWTAIQKYNEEVESFLKELGLIFQQQFLMIDKDTNNIKKMIELEKSKQAEGWIVIVQCLLKSCAIINEAHKCLGESLEKKRQEIGKHRLEMQVGIQLEQCAQKDFTRLLQLYQDERMLENYQHETDSKGKMVAQHFFNEMKTSIKSISSIGKFVSSVGQSVNKVSKMSQQSDENMKIQLLKIKEEEKNLISLLGYTLKNLEDLLLKNYKSISKLKKSFLDDLGKYSTFLNSNIGLIIDEMTQSISIIQQKHEDNVIEEMQAQAQVDQEEKTQLSVEDLDIHNPNQIFQKLLKIFFNEWQQNDYFKSKITKLLHKTLNKKRTSNLTEIIILNLCILGESPQIKYIYPQRQDMQEFQYDFDFSFRGKVTFTLQTSIIINWPKENYAQVPVEIKVTISTFTTRMRICFVPKYLGKSWISMIGQPVLNLDIEPMILQKYNIANIPSAGDIMRELLIYKVKMMTFPNKLTLPIPLAGNKKKV